MAEPTIDSLGGGGNAIPPLAGEGSKTPPAPGKGMGVGTELGGAGNIAPMGAPGAPAKPKTPDQQAEDDLIMRSVPSAVSDISDGMKDLKTMASSTEKTKVADVSDSKVYSLVDHMLSLGWTAQSIENIAKKAGMDTKKFIKEIVNKIQKSGEIEAEKFLRDKIQQSEQSEMGGLPGVPGGPTTGIGSPPPETSAPGKGPNPSVPPMSGGPEQTAKSTASLSDVGPSQKNFKVREAVMADKVIVTKEGTLEKVSDNMGNVLEKLALAIRNTRSATKKLEDTKLRYAGTIALKLKKAMDDEEFGGEGSKDEGDEGLTDDLGGEATEDGDMDKQMVMDGISKVEEGMSMIQDAMGGVESAIESEGTSPEDMTKAEGMMGIASAALSKAKETVKIAKSDIEALSKKKDKKDKKKDKKIDGKMQKAILGGSGKKLAGEGCEAEGSAEDKAEDAAEEKKEASEGDDNLIMKVKARLAELRGEKEANLYPFDKDPYGSADMKIDNINAESAKQQASTANSEIKSQPVTDKDNSRINSEMGQKDLPYKTEGQSTPDKKVTMKGASADVDEVKNAYDKSRLSVELASLQQLKGLLPNPLKEAFVKNMIEAGISKQAAFDIAENAFIDGYEAAQKIIMKEAFTTFVTKEFDDFVKVSEFTENYKVKEASVLASVEDAENGREKTASENPPLRGSKVGDHNEEYKNYWQQVKRDRRGF